jgi:hypothetical protein
MSMATVTFDASLLWHALSGPMRGLIRSPRPGCPAIDRVDKTIIVHVGGRCYLILFEKDILSANVEAWGAGVTWAPEYWRAGYGADEKLWGEIPEEKRLE